MRTKTCRMDGDRFCLLLLTRVSGFSQEPEIPYAGDVRLVANVRPIMFLVARTITLGTNTRSS